MKREKKEEEAKMIVDLGLGLAVLARQSNWNTRGDWIHTQQQQKQQQQKTVVRINDSKC